MTDSPDLRTHFGRLRWARESYVSPTGERLNSIRAAAKFFGWDENLYKSHEQGLRQKDGFKVATAEKYARAFGVSVAWLMSGTGGPYVKPASSPLITEARRA